MNTSRRHCWKTHHPNPHVAAETGGSGGGGGSPSVELQWPRGGAGVAAGGLDWSASLHLRARFVSGLRVCAPHVVLAATVAVVVVRVSSAVAEVVYALVAVVAASVVAEVTAAVAAALTAFVVVEVIAALAAAAAAGHT